MALPLLPFTIDMELLECMPDLVTIERCAGVDEMYGTRKYDGSPFNVRCRIEGRNRKVVDASGMERVSSVQVFLSASPGLTANDKITLPDPWVPTEPNILSIDHESDQNGGYYDAIYC